VTGTTGSSTGTKTVVVTVNSTPTVSISPSTATICNGGNIQLTASGASTYSWSPTTNLTSGTAANPTASPTTTTTYTVTGTGSNGCTATVSRIVTVNSLPTVSISPSTATICSGGSIQITASGATSYTWSPTTNLTSSTVANPTASPTSTTTYTVTGTDANGCVNTVSRVVTVNSNPTVSISPSTAAICNGGNIQLTASGAVNYIWSPTSNLTSSTVANPTASPSSTTTYSVTGTASNGCTATASRIVTVNSLPTVMISPNTAAICNGSNIQLTASGASTYTWSPSTNLSSSTIANPTASPSATTTYTVTGTDGNSCVGTASRIVTVNSLPSVTISPSVTTICAGDNVQLVASGGVSFVWSPSSGLSSTTIANPIASPSVNTTYTVVGTTANGCTGTATKLVPVIALPTVTVTPTTATILTGQSIQLTASGASTYLWTPTAGLDNSVISNPVATPSSNTTYTVKGTAINGCSANATVSITLTSNIMVQGNYAPLVRQLENDVFRVRGNNLQFIYDEQYEVVADATLNYVIYDAQNVSITMQNPISIKRGLNKITIASISSKVGGSGVYIMEVTNSKNEKSYLRFSIQ
jgi:hypothetical protein